MEKTLFVWNIMMNKKNADSIVFLFRRQQLKHNYAPVTDPLTHQYTDKSVSVSHVYFAIWQILSLIQHIPGWKMNDEFIEFVGFDFVHFCVQIERKIKKKLFRIWMIFKSNFFPSKNIQINQFEQFYCFTQNSYKTHCMTRSALTNAGQSAKHHLTERLCSG